MSRCRYCGEVLPAPAATGRPRSYCGPLCRVHMQRTRRRRERLERPPLAPARTAPLGSCSICGTVAVQYEMQYGGRVVARCMGCGQERPGAALRMIG